jgi:hypothetical protein
MKKFQALGISVLLVLVSLGCSSPPPHRTVELSGPYPTTVDYDQSLADMVKAGCYDEVDGEIFRYLLITGTPAGKCGQEEIDLYIFNFPHRRMDYDQAQVEMEGRGFRAATFAELLAFGKRYPKEQKEYRIVALGSTFSGPKNRGNRVARLDFGNWQGFDQRCLSLVWIDEEAGECRFLTVRK